MNARQDTQIPNNRILGPNLDRMVSFDNTEVAFSAKSDAALSRAYWLFKFIGYNKLVSVGQRLTELALKVHFPLRPFIKPTIFKQFCGGETIQECNQTIAELGKYNIGTILDYSVEGKQSELDFDACMHETIATVKKAKGNVHIPFSVFKVTGLARFDLLEKVSAALPLTEKEEIEYERVKQRINMICKAAFESNVPIFIDAEESWIQQAIDDLANAMMQVYNKQRAFVYNTFQLYRKDRLDYLMKSYMMAEKGDYYLGAKLVRGAYMEKERERAKAMNYLSPIQDTKEDTDRDYDAALKFCLAHLNRMAICAGTHNEKSSLFLTELMQQHGISKSDERVFFSQLLGMSDHISYNLAKESYKVVKYVPYGPVSEVLPYLIRRAQENTSVAGQTGRELSLLMKEKQRRRG